MVLACRQHMLCQRRQTEVCVIWHNMGCLQVSVCISLCNQHPGSASCNTDIQLQPGSLGWSTSSMSALA